MSTSRVVARRLSMGVPLVAKQDSVTSGFGHPSEDLILQKSADEAAIRGFY